MQAPGAPLLNTLAEQFGAEIIDTNGALDRVALAGIVFSDAEALKSLNKIVHPAIAAEMDRRMKEQRDTNNVVVLDIPLLAENPRKGLCGVIVVDVPVDVAVHRLVTFRNMDETDARARIAKQATREDRAKIADRIIDNSGDLESLTPQVDDVWAWAQSLPPAADDAGERTTEP